METIAITAPGGPIDALLSVPQGQGPVAGSDEKNFHSDIKVWSRVFTFFDEHLRDAATHE